MSVTPSSCQQTILLCKSLSTQVERGERHPRVVRLNDVQVVSIVGHRAVGWSRPKLVKRMGNVYQTTLILDPDDRLFEGESTRHVFLKKQAHDLALSSLHFLRHNDGKILSRQCAVLKCTLHRIVISNGNGPQTHFPGRLQDIADRALRIPCILRMHVQIHVYPTTPSADSFPARRL